MNKELKLLKLKKIFFIALLAVVLVTINILYVFLDAADNDEVNINEANEVIPVGNWLDAGFFDPNWRDGNGDGTASNPHIITTAVQLAGLAHTINGGSGQNNTELSSTVAGTMATQNTQLLFGVHVHLGADIDLRERAWVAIGGHIRAFRGIFDGQGHTVTLPSTLRSHVGNGADRGFGLFGGLGSFAAANPAIVRNLIVDGDVNNWQWNGTTPGSSGTGAIAGHTVSFARLENVGSRVNFSGKGAILNNGRIGGIVGVALQSGSTTNTTIIDRAVNHGNINGVSGTEARVAGIIAMRGTNVIFTGTNLANYGNITSGTVLAAGGIIGTIRGASGGGDSVRNAYNRGNITVTGPVSGSQGAVGGISGDTLTTGAVTITNVYNFGTISGPATARARQILGLVNASTATVTQAFGRTGGLEITNGGGTATTRGFFNDQGILTTGATSGQTLTQVINNNRGAGQPLWTNPYHINSSNELTTDPLPTFIAPLLQPQNIQIESQSEYITWTAVSGALGYAVFGDGAFLEIVSTNRFAPRLSNLESGSSHNIEVIALGNNILSSNSIPNDFEITLLSTIGDLEIKTGRILSWSAVSNAEGYVININGVPRGVVGGNVTTFDLTTLNLLAGTHNIVVIAYNTAINFLDSSATLAYEIEKLNTPTGLTVGAGRVLSWDSVTNATAYQIFIDNNLVDMVTGTTFNLASLNLAIGTHRIEVVAVGNFILTEPSEPAVLYYVISQLSAPSDLLVGTGRILTWNSVTNAESYAILINGIQVGTSTTNAFDISTFTTNPLVYNIEVIAIGDNVFFTDSIAGTLTYTLSRLQTPTINGVNDVSGSRVLSWTSVSNAVSFLIEIVGIHSETVPATQLTFNLDFLNLPADETYTINITAISDGYNFLNSTIATTTHSINRLSAPQIFGIGAGRILTWGNITNAINFHLVIGTHEETLSATQTSFDLSTLNLGIGSHIINLTAIGDYVNFTDSPVATFTYTIAQLSAPTINGVGIAPNLNTRILSWVSNTDAISYTVSIASVGTETGITTSSFDLAVFNLLAGTFTITVTAHGDGIFFLDSEAQSFTHTITKLATPSNLQVGTGRILSWDAVTDATGYIVYVNGLPQPLVTGTSFNLTSLNLIPGTHSLEVVALGDIATTERSESGTLSYIITQLNIPANIQITTGRILSWDVVFDAIGYTVTINGAPISVSTNSLNIASLTTIANTFNITVVAHGNDVFFTDSEASTFTYTISNLSMPLIDGIGVGTFSGERVISWQPVLNASSYTVNIVGVAILDNITETHLNLADFNLVAGIFTITVTANGDNLFFFNSQAASYTYVITKLATPDNLQIGVGRILTWNTVTNAQFYLVFIDGVEVGTTTNLSFDLTPFTTIIGTYIIELQAVGDSVLTEQSEKASIEYTISQLGTVTINFENNFVVTWNDLANASSFLITYTDGAGINFSQNIANNTSFTLPDNLPLGTFTFTVTAIGDNLFFVDGAVSSATFTISNLNTPNLSINSGNLVWSPILNAVSYTITLNGMSIEVTETYIALSQFNVIATENNTFIIRANADNNVYNNYQFFRNSETDTLVIGKLEAPVISIISEQNDEFIEWAAISGADYYEIWVTRGAGTRTLVTTTTLTTFNIWDWEGGEYLIEVIAASDNPQTMNSVPGIIFHFVEPAQLVTPNAQFIEGTRTLNWSISPNAEEYLIRIDGIEITRINAGTFTITATYFTINTIHVIEIIAIGDGNRTFDSEPKILEFTVTQFSQPDVSLDSDMFLRWNLPIGTDSENFTFEVLLSNGETHKTTSNFFDLSGIFITEGSASAMVRIVGDNVWFYSSVSNPINFTVSTFNFDLLNVDNNMHLVWNVIEYAEHYIITIGSHIITINDITINFLDLTTLGLSNGTHFITITAVANNNFFSEASNATFLDGYGTIFFEIFQLEEPQELAIDVDAFILSWSLVLNATRYTVRLESETTYFTVTTTSFDLSLLDLPAGNHTLIIQAYNDNPFYLASGPVEISFTIVKLAAPQISLNSDTLVLNWQAIDNAGVYHVIVDGVTHIILPEVLSFNLATLNLGVGNFTVVVQAIAANGLFIDSDMSETISFNISRLDTPSGLAVTNGILYWTSNHNNFEIFVNGISVGTSVTNSFNLNLTAVDTYLIVVVAIGNETSILSSNPSSALEYNITQLNAPTELSVVNDVLYWTSNHNNFEIFVNGISVGTSTTNSFTLNLTLVGTYSLTVVALGNNYNILDSNPSTPFEYVIGQLNAPISLAVNNGVLTWVSTHNNFEIFVNGISVGTSTTNSFTLNLALVGTYSLTVVALGNNIDILDSEPSLAYDYIITQLYAPTGLTVNNGILAWTSGHNNFEIFVDGISVGTSTTNSFNLNLTVVGTYALTVMALGNNVDILDSELSAIYSYIIIRLEAPTGLAVNNGVLTWVSTHNNFEIFIDGVSIGTSATNSFNLNLTVVGTYSLTVIALGNNIDILDSEPSAAYTYKIIQLEAPTGLAVNNGVLSWISNHDSFEIFVDGVSVGTKTTNSFTLDLTNVGIYSITVMALGNNIDILDSSLSVAYVYTISQLEAPTGLAVNNGILTWSSAHDNFEIFIDGFSIGTISTNNFSLNLTHVGTYLLTVVALGNNIDILDSNPSIAYSYTIIQLNAPTGLEVINGVLYWASIYNNFEIFVDGLSVGTSTTNSFALNLTEVGVYSIIVVALGNNIDILDSGPSASYTYTIIQLDAPTGLAVNDGILVWVSAHDSFEIFIDGVSAGFSTTNSFNLNLPVVGTYSLTVIALGNNIDILNSEPSAAYVYEIIQLEAPTGLAVNNGILSWISVHDNFEIFIDGVSVGTSLTNSFDLNLIAEGTYVITVVALGNNIDVLDSNPSVSFEFVIGQLNAPTGLAVNNGILSWVSGHNSFEIFIDGVSVGTSTTNSFILDLTNVGIYSITVMALGNNVDILDSELSVAYVYEIIQLDAPTGLAVNNGILTWTSTHDNFEIFIDGVSIGTAATNSFTLDLTNAGIYSITVMSLGNNVDVLDSELSVAYVYEIIQLDAPTELAVNNGILTWTSTHDNFEIFIDGVSVGTSTANSFTLDLTNVGIYSITVKALGNNINVLDSELSVAYTYEIVQLEAPIGLAVNNGILTWSSTHDSFEIFLDGVSVGTTNTNSFTLNLTTIGVYILTVVAIGDNITTLDSDPSNEYEYIIRQLDAPIGLAVNNGVLTWTSSHNYFEIFINGVSVGTTNTNSFTLNLTSIGTHFITVVALGNNIDILDSISSLEYDYTIIQLAAPTGLAINNGVLTWISNHNSFEIFVNGESVGTSTTNSFTLDLTPGTYQIYVLAVGNGFTTISATSDIYEHTVSAPELTRLTAPTGLAVNNGVLSWISNHNYFEIFVDGVSVGKATINSFTLDLTSPGEYSITVVALGDNITTLSE